MHKLKYLTISIILLLLFSVVGPSFDVAAAPLAATSPTLNVLLGYSVLGGSGITNVPTTTTNEDIGVSPGTSTGGGYAGGGTVHSNDSSAIAAQAEALSVFGALDQTCDLSFGAVDLSTTNFAPFGGVGTVSPGVFCSTSSFSLSGNLNLTGSGVWIFKTVSTLITSPGSSVTGGGDACNVWWRIGSSTTLDTTTSFLGTVISQTGSNSMLTNATLNGRFLALSGADVVLQQNTITTPPCTTAPSGGTTGGEEARLSRFSVSGLPNTGGAPIREEFPWSIVIVAGLSAIVLSLGVRSYRRKLLPKQ